MFKSIEFRDAECKELNFYMKLDDDKNVNLQGGPFIVRLVFKIKAVGIRQITEKKLFQFGVGLERKEEFEFTCSITYETEKKYTWEEVFYHRKNFTENVDISNELIYRGDKIYAKKRGGTYHNNIIEDMINYDQSEYELNKRMYGNDPDKLERLALRLKETKKFHHKIAEFALKKLKESGGIHLTQVDSDHIQDFRQSYDYSAYEYYK